MIEIAGTHRSEEDDIFKLWAALIHFLKSQTTGLGSKQTRGFCAATRGEISLLSSDFTSTIVIVMERIIDPLQISWSLYVLRVLSFRLSLSRECFSGLCTANPWVEPNLCSPPPFPLLSVPNKLFNFSGR